MIIPGSCSSGFRSRPSIAAGISRTNGLEVKIRNDRKPMLTRPMIPSTRATTSSGSLRERLATTAVQTARISVHSSSEPSCEPRSEEHTSELQSLMRTSYAVFCLKKKHIQTNTHQTHDNTTTQNERHQ